jgi:hypothetical protein
MNCDLELAFKLDIVASGLKMQNWSIYEVWYLLGCYAVWLL